MITRSRTEFESQLGHSETAHLWLGGMDSSKAAVALHPGPTRPVTAGHSCHPRTASLTAEPPLALQQTEKDDQSDSELGGSLAR